MYQPGFSIELSQKHSSEAYNIIYKMLRQLYNCAYIYIWMKDLDKNKISILFRFKHFKIKEEYWKIFNLDSRFSSLMSKQSQKHHSGWNIYSQVNNISDVIFAWKKIIQPHLKLLLCDLFLTFVGSGFAYWIRQQEKNRCRWVILPANKIYLYQIMWKWLTFYLYVINLTWQTKLILVSFWQYRRLLLLFNIDQYLPLS